MYVGVSRGGLEAHLGVSGGDLAAHLGIPGMVWGRGAWPSRPVAARTVPTSRHPHVWWHLEYLECLGCLECLECFALGPPPH